MKGIAVGIGIFVVIVSALTGLMFYSGFIGNAYDATIGKQNMNIQRQNFEQSQSYVDGKLQDLANEYRQYNLATSNTDKQTILNYVQESFGSFDARNVTDPALYNFLMKARGE